MDGNAYTTARSTVRTAVARPGVLQSEPTRRRRNPKHRHRGAISPDVGQVRPPPCRVRQNVITDLPQWSDQNRNPWQASFRIASAPSDLFALRRAKTECPTRGGLLHAFLHYAKGPIRQKRCATGVVDPTAKGHRKNGVGDDGSSPEHRPTSRVANNDRYHCDLSYEKPKFQGLI